MRTTVRSAQSAFHLSEVRIELPVNAFKRALIERRQQIGLWCSLPGAYVAEALAGSGFDWMLFDTEHSPGDPLTVLAQLQAVAPYPVSPVVRPASNDPVLIKRFLDIGAQTRLIPSERGGGAQGPRCVRTPSAGSWSASEVCPRRRPSDEADGCSDGECLSFIVT
jgi:hypothetical protein